MITPYRPSSFCAFCTADVGADPRTILHDDAIITICAACADEPARAISGPERGYEPSGGILSADDIDRAMAKRIGETEYRAILDRDRRAGKNPTPTLPADVVDWNMMRREGRRRARVGLSATEPIRIAARRASRVEKRRIKP